MILLCKNSFDFSSGIIKFTNPRTANGHIFIIAYHKKRLVMIEIVQTNMFCSIMAKNTHQGHIQFIQKHLCVCRLNIRFFKTHSLVLLFAAFYRQIQISLSDFLSQLYTKA